MIDPVLYWNAIALEIHRRDFNGERVMPEVAGPTRASRALAMTHLAIHDAMMAHQSGARTYLSAAQLPAPSAPTASREAAVGAAAVTVLGTLFARPQGYLQEQANVFEQHLSSSQSAADIAAGWEFGEKIGQAVLQAREKDNSGICSAYHPGTAECEHRQDPYHPDQGFLDPHWGHVTRFYVDLNDIPREDPPKCGTERYNDALEQVRLKGALTGHTRTVDETVQGVFWAYDGARGIGTPPRLYNQCVRTIAMQKRLNPTENARLFALVNVAMADAGIIAWFEKYEYDLWRPVIGVREAGADWGPTEQGPAPANPDPFWRPYGSPASNQPGMTNSTPNFPAYPSGHATFGTACFRVVCLFFGGENVAWTQISDEFDGRTLDPDGSVRSLHRRPLDLETAIQENLCSRLYLGVHWLFDGTRGEAIGNQIAERLFNDDVLGLRSLAMSNSTALQPQSQQAQPPNGSSLEAGRSRGKSRKR